jgi:tRNA(Ile)-lysidine synthase
MTQVHPFARRVLDTIHQEQLIAENDAILVAVSGGPDSVALLHVLVSLRELCRVSRIEVLHFDHQLRGSASAADMEFVKGLGTTLGLQVYTASEDVHSYHHRHHISVEMAARACRHRFFRDALTRLEAKAIALGHTANDQAEEILLRLFRGAGPSGMAGMLPRTAGGLIRPLLFATRDEILAYLHDRQISFREDVSNRDPAHQRNAVRHTILPLLGKHFHPRLVEVLCRHARLAADEESCWRDLLATHWHAVCTAEAHSRITLSGPALLALHPALQRRLLRLAIERLQASLQGIYAQHIEALCKLLASGASSRSIQLPGGFWALQEGEFLTLSREPRESLPAIQEDFSRSMNGPGDYQFPTFELRLSLKNVPRSADAGPIPDAPDTIWLDAGTIKWPLFLRFWKNGDRFRPLGLGGSKKLQDFFIDSRVLRKERSRVPLLCDQQKICWVVGYRLDDRVKVTPQTEQILIIEKCDRTRNQ